MSRIYQFLLATVIALPIGLATSAPAEAQGLKWPSSTYQREQKPAWIGTPRWTDRPSAAQPQQQASPSGSTSTAGPSSPPAVAEKKPAAAAVAAASKDSTAAACKPGETCVKCVANCADKAPTTVQKLDPEQVAAAKPASGPPDTPVGHGRWNAIRCYEGGGCTATGVSAPRRIERSSDGYVTYWRFW